MNVRISSSLFPSAIAATLIAAITLPLDASAQTFTVKAESRDKVRGKKGHAKFFGSFGAPALADNGAIAVYSTIYGRKISRRTNKTVCLIRPARLARVIVQTGFKYTIVGTQSTYSINYFALTKTPGIAKSGRTAFLGAYQARIPTPQDDLDTYFSTAVSNSSGKKFRIYRGNKDFYIDSINAPFDMNDRNHLSILGQYQTVDDEGNDQYVQTIAFMTAKKFRPLISVGEAPVGLPLDVTYTEFGTPVLDDNDFAYFSADISDSDLDFDGVWYGKNGDPAPLITKGESVPVNRGGSVTTVTLQSFADAPHPSPNGSLCAFAAGTTSGTVNDGIWVVTPSTGDIANVVYSSVIVDGQTIQDFEPPAINDSGKVVFLAKPSGSSDPDGLFVSDSTGSEVRKIAAVGDTITVDGQEKTIISLLFNPRYGLNNKGDIAFTASFDDRSSAVLVTQ